MLWTYLKYLAYYKRLSNVNSLCIKTFTFFQCYFLIQGQGPVMLQAQHLSVLAFFICIAEEHGASQLCVSWSHTPKVPWLTPGLSISFKWCGSLLQASKLLILKTWPVVFPFPFTSELYKSFWSITELSVNPE